MSDKKDDSTEAPERCKACKGDGTLTGCRGSGDCKRCGGSGVEPDGSAERRRLLKIIGDVGADRGRQEGTELAARLVMERASALFARGEDDLAVAFRCLAEMLRARPAKDHPHDEVEHAFRVLVVREDLNDSSEGGVE